MIHGDVDSANVLLWGEDEHWIAKLGYYEITNLRQEYMTVNQGESNDLLALEAPIASQVESTKVDVFSYGLLLFEMYYKFPLVSSAKDCHARLFTVVPQHLQWAILKCTEKKPEMRPSMSDIIWESPLRNINGVRQIDN